MSGTSILLCMGGGRGAIGVDHMLLTCSPVYKTHAQTDKFLLLFTDTAYPNLVLSLISVPVPTSIYALYPVLPASANLVSCLAFFFVLYAWKHFRLLGFFFCCNGLVYVCTFCCTLSLLNVPT